MMRSMALPAVRPASMWRSVRLLDCQSPGAIASLEVAAEPVAALARNHVQAHAAGRRVGADAGGLVAHLLVHRVVGVALHGAVGLQAVDHHAVDHDGVVGGGHPVRGHVGLLHGARAADVRQVQVDADDELADALDRAAGRNASIASRSSTCVCTAVVTSTTGDSPVTVIVSSSAPTFSRR